MRAIVAAALTALLAVSFSSLLVAADQPEAGSGTTTVGAAAEEGSADPKTSPAGEAANPDPSQDPAKAAPGSSTMNVNRHRPGACPEGPPCKEGD